MAHIENRAEAESPEDLVQRLASGSWQARQSARRALVATGRRFTPMLVEALRTGSDDLRWEAARTLEELRDPESIPVLIEALEDRNPGVRWLASQALVAIGQPVLVPLLRRLLVRSESPWLQEGAHHVLRSLVSPELTLVVKALEGPHVAIAVLPPVNDALATLERTG